MGEQEFCRHTMTRNRRCGRKSGHPGYHQSELSLGKKSREQNEKRAARRAQLPAHGGHPEVPAQLLPGTALASLVKYKKSGLWQPGDMLYEKIARRLLEREGLVRVR
jgi:hypothetical protein